jgi:ABC-2 type transport system ATP-binding protein
LKLPFDYEIDVGVAMEDIVCKDLTRIYESSQRKWILGEKTTKSVTAVDDLNLKVEEGELFGLLGPNGAGKTTTVKMLCTLLLPTSGYATVRGYDVVKNANQVRRIVNMVAGGERMIYYRLTGRENLEYFAELYDVSKERVKSRVSNLLELVGLKNRADDEVEKYSKGMKQRLQIARGLINDPQVLFLDEPTIGLDVDIAKDIRQFIRKKLVDEQGKTVLLTTHYMAEAEEICDRVGFLFKGKLVALGTPSELSRMLGKFTTIELVVQGATEQAVKGLGTFKDIEVVSIENIEYMGVSAFKITLHVTSDELTPQTVVHFEKSGAKVVSLNVRKPNLEDAYIHLSRRQES